MANEITLQWRLIASKNNAGIDTSLVQKQLTLVGNEMTSPTQSIGFAADEVLGLNDVPSAAGYLVVRNLDTTNFVSLSTATGGSFAAATFAKIRAGCVAIFQPVGAVYAKADTAAVRVQIHAVEL